MVDDLTKYTGYTKFPPAKHVATWYSLADIDGYIEKYFNSWKNLTRYTDLNAGITYDASDSTT